MNNLVNRRLGGVNIKFNMANLVRGVFVVAAKRTPFGTFGGKFKDISATELAAVANKAAMESGNISPDNIDSVIIGNVSQVSNRAQKCYTVKRIDISYFKERMYSRMLGVVFVLCVSCTVGATVVVKK